MTYEIVDVGEVAVRYTIIKLDDGMYDWSSSNGSEPDQWFETAEEARQDAIRTLGG